MRFTLARMQRLVAYVAVALAIAVAFSRQSWVGIWLFSAPMFISAVCLAWALFSLVILTGPARYSWFRLWAYASAGGLILMIVSVLLALGAMWIAGRGSTGVEPMIILGTFGALIVPAVFFIWPLLRLLRRRLFHAESSDSQPGESAPDQEILP